ncbi:MAG: hypothetical protein R3F62_26160 [Planctomycetota bacterium]
MSDFERAVGQRNAFQKLLEHIPGFKGYMDRETRRDVDKAARDFCANKLFALKTPVKRALDALISGGDIDGITPFEKLLNQLDRVAQTIQNADRGYSGLFDTVKIDEETLAQVHEYDLSLAEAVTEVEHKVSEMDPSDREKLMGKVRETNELLDRVGTYFSRREELLRKGG